MSKVKTKLTALLVALSCVFACLCVCFSVANLDSQAKADDPTVIEIDGLVAIEGSSSGSIMAVPTGDVELTVNDDDWDVGFTYVEDSGKGFVWKSSEDWFICQPEDGYLYIEFSASASAGDEFIIDGEFYSENSNVTLVFNNCGLKYDGTTWASFTPTDRTIYNVGELTLHVNSQPYGGAGTVNNNLYLQRADGEDYEQYGWKSLFVGKADGFKVNGAPATLNKMFSTDAGIFFDFAAANAGDVITISGSFVNESEGVEFVIAESSFMWTANGWVKTGALTTYEVGKVVIGNGSGAGAVYFAIESGAKFEKVDDTWAEKLTYAAGTGVTINGTQINMGDIKIPNDIYVGLGETFVPNEGDVLVIGGTFYNNNLKVKYVIEDSSFTWNGTAWEKTVTVTNLGEVVAVVDGSTSSAYLQFADGITLPVSSWDLAFNQVTGNGITVDGTAIVLDNNIKSMGNKIYVEFKGVEVETDSVLKISGSFLNEATANKYVIAESVFTWNGSAWSQYVDYTVYNVDAIKAEGSSTDSVLHIIPADGDGESFGAGDWDNVYTFAVGSGDGLKLNDTVLTTTDIKQPGSFFIALKTTAVAGDILTIDGTYYNATTAKKIIFDNSQLKFNGTQWVTYVEIDYTTHELGSLVVHGNSAKGSVAAGLNNAVYLWVSEGDLPVKAWENPFFYESGEGFKLNGEPVTLLEMQSTGDGFYLKFNAISAHDVISVGGTFICPSQAVKYVIEESKFIWNGKYWEVYSELVESEIGEMRIIPDSSDTTTVYLYRADGEALPYTDNWVCLFHFGKDSGLFLNDEPISYGDIKAPGDLFIQLGKTVEVGDVLKIKGTLYSASASVAFVITESTFVYTESGWRNQIDIIKDGIKAELTAHYETFSADDYYDAEATLLETLYNEGLANIDASQTEADARLALENAKADLDAVDTKEESDAKLSGKKVEAKDELNAYKAQADYHEAQWAEIQAIIADASAGIDACLTTSEITPIVEAAKAQMDEVYTADVYDAHQSVVDTAKADLASYKAEADYKAEQWAEIQAIIAGANADIEEAFGDADAIAQIVEDAKTDIDGVKTAVVVDAENLAKAKEDGKTEVQAYYSAIDYTLYTDDAFAQISALVEPALTAIDGATSIDEVTQLIASFKASVDAVEQIQPEPEKSGCMSSIGGGLLAGLTPVMALALVKVLRKKED